MREWAGSVCHEGGGEAETDKGKNKVFLGGREERRRKGGVGGKVSIVNLLLLLFTTSVEIKENGVSRARVELSEMYPWRWHPAMKDGRKIYQDIDSFIIHTNGAGGAEGCQDPVV